MNDWETWRGQVTECINYLLKSSKKNEELIANLSKKNEKVIGLINHCYNSDKKNRKLLQSQVRSFQKDFDTIQEQISQLNNAIDLVKAQMYPSHVYQERIANISIPTQKKKAFMDKIGALSYNHTNFKPILQCLCEDNSNKAITNFSITIGSTDFDGLLDLKRSIETIVHDSNGSLPSVSPRSKLSMKLVLRKFADIVANPGTELFVGILVILMLFVIGPFIISPLIR
jgi:hypothetical protein